VQRWFEERLLPRLSRAPGSCVRHSIPDVPRHQAGPPSDYHAGKIAFSYLGDIWTANEDGTAPQRLTDNRGHEVDPRFSPDGRWIAFSSNRYGNNDVFVVAATGARRGG